jgi:predicted small secreted protein
MSIKFTKHALERLKNRNISKDEILKIVNECEDSERDKYGNFIKKKKKGKYLIVYFIL